MSFRERDPNDIIEVRKTESKIMDFLEKNTPCSTQTVEALIFIAIGNAKHIGYDKEAVMIALETAVHRIYGHNS